MIVADAQSHHHSVRDAVHACRENDGMACHAYLYEYCTFILAARRRIALQCVDMIMNYSPISQCTAAGVGMCMSIWTGVWHVDGTILQTGGFEVLNTVGGEAIGIAVAH
jgi:hypothetical protein